MKDIAHLRRNMLVMSRRNCTPVSVWLDMSLREFNNWCDADDALIHEKK